MEVLTYERLDEILKTGLSKAQFLSIPTHNTMYLQYLTGIRLSEVDPTRWHILENGNYFLHTKKYNHPREFTPEQIPTEWHQAIVNQDDFSYITNHSTYERRLRIVFGRHYFMSGKKRIVSHIFRHRWAKMKKAETQDNEAVREALGEKRLSSALSYIASDIKYLEW